jgi:hypothetical protein
MALQSMVPCGRCGRDTVMVGSRRCDPCWELERLIEGQPRLAAEILRQLGAPAEEYPNAHRIAHVADELERIRQACMGRSEEPATEGGHVFEELSQWDAVVRDAITVLRRLQPVSDPERERFNDRVAGRRRR